MPINDSVGWAIADSVHVGCSYRQKYTPPPGQKQPQPARVAWVGARSIDARHGPDGTEAEDRVNGVTRRDEGGSRGLLRTLDSLLNQMLDGLKTRKVLEASMALSISPAQNIISRLESRIEKERVMKNGRE